MTLFRTAEKSHISQMEGKIPSDSAPSITSKAYTIAPSDAKTSAMDRPIPRAAPVIIQILSLNSSMRFYTLTIFGLLKMRNIVSPIFFISFKFSNKKITIIYCETFKPTIVVAKNTKYGTSNLHDTVSLFHVKPISSFK